MTVTFVSPPDGIYHFEDVTLGASAPLGRRVITREEIIAFATAYDPQPIHLDEVAARNSIVGGLCASGFHTCAIMMRLLCDFVLLRSSSLGSPGLDEVKWLKPVRPGDTLALILDTHSKRVLESRPDVGLSHLTISLIDQAGAPVMTALTNQLMRLRHPDAAAVAFATSARSAARPKPTAAPAPDLWATPEQHLSAPDQNHFEDVVVGDVRDLGSHTFARDDIIAFARAYDPQPFHLDEEAGRQSLFGGLSASGWHTAAIFIRKVVDTRAAHNRAVLAAGHKLAAWGPSPGFKNLQWPKPVLAGDTVSFRQQVINKIELKSRPDRGLVVTRCEGRNQKGDIVYRFTGQMFVERRTPQNALDPKA